MDRHLCLLRISYGEIKESIKLKGEIKNDPRSGGLAKPVEVGCVCIKVVSEPTIFVSVGEGRQKESWDINSTWDRFEQCHPEDVKID
jgi:hypothetical protein